jgi:hypothetical protein
MKAGRHINLTGDYSWRQNKRVEKGFGACPFMEAISRTLPSGLVQRILE